MKQHRSFNPANATTTKPVEPLPDCNELEKIGTMATSFMIKATSLTKQICELEFALATSKKDLEQLQADFIQFEPALAKGLAMLKPGRKS